MFCFFFFFFSFNSRVTGCASDLRTFITTHPTHSCKTIRTEKNGCVKQTSRWQCCSCTLLVHSESPAKRSSYSQ
uniref:Putative secreted protein n=1 Tax=Rhipicephalus microplus TaxID=6941 RepID=A0A6M2DEW5_RHIMP